MKTNSNDISKSKIFNIKIRPRVTELRISIKRLGGFNLVPPTSLILNAYSFKLSLGIKLYPNNVVHVKTRYTYGLH